MKQTRFHYDTLATDNAGGDPNLAAQPAEATEATSLAADDSDEAEAEEGADAASDTDAE